jgi:diketogulonate reductase-like aldo/keto reductase
VWTDRLGYEDVLSSTAEGVEKPGVDALDLLYVRWPTGDYDPDGTLRAFDELYAEGRIDRVGVSNFPPARLEEAIERLDAPVFANQVECHPLFQQRDPRATCEAHDVEVVAHSPLARGAVFDEPTLASIADARDVSAAQVSLVRPRANGVTAIPKPSTEAHPRDNLASLDLELTAGEVAAVDAIDAADR